MDPNGSYYTLWIIMDPIENDRFSIVMMESNKSKFCFSIFTNLIQILFLIQIQNTILIQILILILICSSSGCGCAPPYVVLISQQFIHDPTSPAGPEGLSNVITLNV